MFSQFFTILFLSTLSFSALAEENNIEKIINHQKEQAKNFSDFAVSMIQVNAGETTVLAQKNFKDDEILHLASVSKQFTGAAIAKLILENKLNLDEYVKDILPNWPRYAEDVKVTHLLNHSSGLLEYTKECWKYLDYSPKFIFNKFVTTQTRLKFQPGSKYNYNNTGYVMLARIVEVISGLNFPQYIKQNFFIPLNMTDSLLRGYDAAKPQNIKKVYYQNGLIPIPQISCSYVPGDGGVYTNLKDLKKWAKFLLGESNLGSEIPSLIFTPSGSANKNYGFGYKLNRRNASKLKYHDHGGVWLGTKTGIAIFPTTKNAIIVLGNTHSFKSNYVLEKLADEIK